ncbi:DUF2637 domain-containing protein [Streptomyces sp. BI20]|uniref:DUF2637 domain-containing protein n=1 Tax=Streptomyces sp. BI20 TaxID=3403460 RepID=UPI003C78FD0E
MAAIQLTRTHRILIGVVIAGAVVIAGIGFAGSYAAVRELALKKGFGDFSLVFPIGIDAGICVLLALDLLLTWIRIPFPLLRQTAWLLTVATIAFNGAAAWPDPLGVGMHAVIPVLFVVTVEAARHAVGRIADITADRHMEGVRITRWLLSPVPTFKLWRRMKLWELRSYQQAVTMEQDRLIYQARLQARFGRGWRRKAPVESLVPLRLARIGVPLSQTAATGLAAAGIEPVLLPPAPPAAELPEPTAAPALPQATPRETPGAQTAQTAPTATPPTATPAATAPQEIPNPLPTPVIVQAEQHHRPHQPAPFAVDPTAMPAAHNSAWFAAPVAPKQREEHATAEAETEHPAPAEEHPAPEAGVEPRPTVPAPRAESAPAPTGPAPEPAPAPAPEEHRRTEADLRELAYEVFSTRVAATNVIPTPGELADLITERHGPLEPHETARVGRLMPEIKARWQRELESEHIA